MSLGGIYGWVVKSMGAAANVNDFSTPLTYLTAATAALLVNLPANPVIPASPNLPLYLDADGSAPWGNATVEGTNPYTFVPETGKTRHYTFSIERGIIAPDGYNKSSLLVNGKYPGPLIEANWGDWIEVEVFNHIAGPEEGTTLHWHGISQKSSSWLDGTPGISQCPIAPGARYTYKFRADTYGTSWYHSHYSAQYLDGLWGPVVIYGPTHANYDIDVGAIMVHDYYRQDYTRLVKNAVGSNALTALLTPSDTVVIHGTNYACAPSSAHDSDDCKPNPGLAKFQFTAGKVHRLRLINPSSAACPLLFSIDDHSLTVIANDFTPVVPYQTTVVSLSAGQRTDVLVTGTGKPGTNTWMRIRAPDLCNYGLNPFGLAAIYYDGADTNGFPTSLPQPAFMKPRLTECINDPLKLTTPAYAIQPAAQPDVTLKIVGSLTVNSTGHTLYTMNNSSYRADYSAPLLPIAAAGSTDYPLGTQANVYDVGEAKTIRIVFVNTLSFAHPMHLHGFTMTVLAEGVGQWNGTITNPTNPQRRDTQIVQANGYMVIQLVSDNPGVWPFHCHIAWHLSAGMHINLVTQPKALASQDIPSYVDKTCDAWNRWTAKNTVDEVDSGM